MSECHTSVGASACQPSGTSGTVLPPTSVFVFCYRLPSECSETAHSGGPVVLDGSRWAQLDAVNSDVNRNIHYVADSRTFDRSEYWTLPQGQGDCEDLALEKRRRQIGRAHV